MTFVGFVRDIMDKDLDYCSNCTLPSIDNVITAKNNSSNEGNWTKMTGKMRVRRQKGKEEIERKCVYLRNPLLLTLIPVVENWLGE